MAFIQKIKGLVRRVLFLKSKKPAYPSYHEKRALIENHRMQSGATVFIETGTFLGDTVDFFKDKFDTVYSIELSAELAQKAQKRFAAQKNVKIIQGNSGEVLSDITRQLSKPAMFWLDGHYSSEFFVNGEFIRTAKADKDTPIESELRILMQSEQPHIILIDDARLFVGAGDYPSIDQIKKIIGTGKYNYTLTIDTDIINIIPAQHA
jgi:hypothetical protein